MKYYDALCRSGEILEAYFTQTQNIKHPASKGNIRENILRKVIRPFYLCVMVFLLEKLLMRKVM